jgi:hypothetical protein
MYDLRVLSHLVIFPQKALAGTGLEFRLLAAGSPFRRHSSTRSHRILSKGNIAEDGNSEYFQQFHSTAENTILTCQGR